MPAGAGHDPLRRGRRRDPRARPSLRRRAVGRRVRAHRRLPGSVPHARERPARRSERGHREPRPAGWLGLRPAADRLHLTGRPARGGQLRHLPLAGRQPARGARPDAGAADGSGDRDARPGPTARAHRLGREPGAVGARLAAPRAGAGHARAAGGDRSLPERDAPARRLRAAGRDVLRARRPAAAALGDPADAVHPVDRRRRHTAGRGPRGLADHRRPRPPARLRRDRRVAQSAARDNARRAAGPTGESPRSAGASRPPSSSTCCCGPDATATTSGCAAAG